jgi:hypothetical protein
MDAGCSERGSTPSAGRTESEDAANDEFGRAVVHELLDTRQTLRRLHAMVRPWSRCSRWSSG